MTTIVVSQKQKLMVADSACTGGGPAVMVDKIIEVDGKLVGICGTPTHALKFVEWLRTGEKPTYMYEKDEDSFAALVLTDDGLYYYDKELMALPIKDDVVAVGSGSEYALGAVDAGATLKRAVEIAARRDQYSAPPVLVRKLPRKRR